MDRRRGHWWRVVEPRAGPPDIGAEPATPATVSPKSRAEPTVTTPEPVTKIPASVVKGVNVEPVFEITPDAVGDRPSSGARRSADLMFEKNTSELGSRYRCVIDVRDMTETLARPVDQEPDSGRDSPTISVSGRVENLRLLPALTCAQDSSKSQDLRIGDATRQLHTAHANAGIALMAAASALVEISKLQMPLPKPPSTPVSDIDRRVIEALAAPGTTHRRLLQAAHQVSELLMADSKVSFSVELYGSLSLGLARPDGESRQHVEWPLHYVNMSSDVDFVVEMGNRPPSAVVRLLEKGSWRKVGETQVPKFAVTQYTLRGFTQSTQSTQLSCAEVSLDVTCISEATHFARFKRRQAAFHRIFLETRSRLEAQFGIQGAMAFDAYIHLLKAFAAKVPGNSLAGFQATCLGLFTLRANHFRLRPTQSIASSLFEGFLRFCAVFYAEPPYRPSVHWQATGYQHCAIDLSGDGGWLPRVNNSWRTELYFMAAEAEMQVPPDERMNVTHSLDPVRVAAEAQSLLFRAFPFSLRTT